MACIPPLTGGGILSGTLGYLDCQAQTIGAAGYQALASTSSSTSIALTTVLTIFIGWFGIKMMLGSTPSFGDLSTTALKVGLVLLLASSWSAYQITAYNLILFGPAELVGDIGGAASLPGSTGGLISRLQAVDDALVSLINIGTGRGDLDAVQNAVDLPMPTSQALNDDFSFNWARMIYISSTLSVMGLIRVFAGLLLALAPVFAGFLLLRQTRSAFFGWVKALAATVISAISATIILGVALAVFEPLLADALGRRSANLTTFAAPFELLALAITFALMLLGAVFLSVRLCFSFSPSSARAAPRQPNALPQPAQNQPQQRFGSALTSASNDRQDQSDQSRASAIARSFQVQERMSGNQSESASRRITVNEPGRTPAGGAASRFCKRCSQAWPNLPPKLAQGYSHISATEREVMKQDASTTDYFERAGSWADDRLSSLKASRKVAWVISICAVVVAVAEALALVALSPLKTVVPYTLLVDRQTGFVQQLKPTATDQIAPDAALTQSFLVQYVLAREGFDIATVQTDFRKVALWSAEKVRAEYSALMQISNPESPLTRLPRTAVVEARARSVSVIGKDTAMVRFETVRIDQGANQAAQSWVAIVNYRYQNNTMSAEDRYINPLGFQVVRYRRSLEALPSPQPAAVSLAAPTVPAAVPRQRTVQP